MPGMDGTGPLGQGALTGRGLGPCGRGLGVRRGLGRGFGRRCWVPQGYAYPTRAVNLTKEQEEKILEAEKADLESELTQIQEEIKQITQKIQEIKKK